jgi:uncharacterized protein YgiB involved in biofilm formation
VLAGQLNDRQHKCHQRWRLLKQTASTNVITAGGFLGRPSAQNSSLLAVAPTASTNVITAGGFLGRPSAQNSSLLAVA